MSRNPFQLCVLFLAACAAGGGSKIERQGKTNNYVPAPSANHKPIVRLEVTHSEPRCATVPMQDREVFGCLCPWGEECHCALELVEGATAASCLLRIATASSPGQQALIRSPDGGVFEAGNPVVDRCPTCYRERVLKRGNAYRVCSLQLECPELH